MIGLPQIIIIILFTVMIVAFIIAFIIIYQKRHAKHLLEKKLLHAAYRQELLQTQLEIQEHTFRNISQEIHDNIGQALSLAKLNLGTLQNLGEQKFADAQYLVGKAITDLRDLSRSLHGEKIAETGLAAAVENELKMLRNSGRFETRFAVHGSMQPLAPQQEMLLFRIVQEALHNAVKHSAGSCVTVELCYTASHLQLRVTDNGQGFDPATLKAAETGIGLKNMRNRASMAGATLDIRPQPGNGTEVLIHLPIAAQ